IVSDESALGTRAESLIDQILRNAPDAVAACKARSLAVADAILDKRALDALIEEHASRRSTQEAIEGSKSFMERRDPAWYPLASKT
ncbi:MAG: hypothetical protein ACO3C0_12950, partial [Burkholderiaceae bacterium]